MHLLHAIDELEPFRGGILVPTMGALHDGHLSLVRLAATLGGPVVVSIFVNPRQFAPDEDLDTYPRTLEADLAGVREAGADVAWVPSNDAIYPPTPDQQPSPREPLPTVATQPGLEDRFRGHFFDGVCTVVARLLDLARPAAMVLGEKGWQQWQVLRAMVAAAEGRWGDLLLHVGPVRRESDGLAMSSRNVYIDPSDRQRAGALHQALLAAQACSSGDPEAAMLEVLHAATLTVDYAVVRDAVTLLEAVPGEPRRALIAARLGPLRLIDNMPLGPQDSA